MSISLGASIARFYSEDDGPLCAVSRQMRCLVHFHVHLQCLTPECIAWCSRCTSEIVCCVTHHNHEETSWIKYSGIVVSNQDDDIAATTHYAWHPQHDVILCKTCLAGDDTAVAIYMIFPTFLKSGNDSRNHPHHR